MRDLRVALALAGLAFALALQPHGRPAEGLSIGFSQTTGFEAESAILQTLDGLAPVAGRGGLEAFGAITGPPGPPIGDGSAPPGIWRVIGWGCDTSPVFTSCAPDGITDPAASDPFANPNRSALRITGLSGFLTDLDWQDITLIEHHNNIISGNALQTIEIDSILRLGADPVAIADPETLVINFRETRNLTCGVAPLPGAPINPLGSTCDDFFLVEALNLAPIALGGGVFIDFRLDPRDGALVCTGVPANDPPACGGYVGNAIIVYTAESDTNSLAVQARLRVVPVAEPATLLLLGIGILGAAIVRRR